MGLTEQQKRALEHARDVLTEERTGSSLQDAEWRRALRLALRDILAAFEGELS